MQAQKKDHLTRLGTTLRQLILANAKESGRTYRHLSKSIGMEANYIASYLSVPVEKWAVPKPPTFGALLREIGITEDDLQDAAYAPSVNADVQGEMPGDVELSA